MKRFVLSALVAAAALAALVPAAHAASPQTATFDVDIALTTNCIISTPPSTVSFTYVAFQGSASALDTNGTFSVKCTNHLNYTMALDNAGSYTDTATALTYTLGLSAGSATGSGAAQSYSITGNMPANQAGNCAASGASCTNAGGAGKTRTLTVSY